ncbi:hypothetical protein U1769_00830 [Sphingomonas sp. ZT3P38]|uniref:hypothetical protein n=1 Tax=Parasphingomonas zepuensis TaxID=3096161 RepID=UPI002FC7DE23
MASWLATTISVITGGVLTMLAAWLADRRLTERDRERRREEQRERLATRRTDFQRQTLLALQEASQKLLRNTGASLHQDVVAHRTTGKWQRQRLPDDLSNDHLRLITETMLLASRVRDDEVRALADRLRSQTAVVGISSGESEAQNRMMAAADTQGALIQRIGEIVRGLDEAD